MDVDAQWFGWVRTLFICLSVKALVCCPTDSSFKYLFGRGGGATLLALLHGLKARLKLTSIHFIFAFCDGQMLHSL